MIEYLGERAITMTSDEKEVLAKKIADYLVQNELQYMTAIYYNNIRLIWDCNLNKYITTKDVKATDWLEFDDVCNQHICMSFEGDLYNVINCYTDTYDELDMFDKFLESLGMTYELGDAWNMVILKKG